MEIITRNIRFINRVSKKSLFSLSYTSLRKEAVTPRTGVWIETIFLINSKLICPVTPRTGVWIETASDAPLSEMSVVTPRTGVWIETPSKKSSLHPR